MRESMGKGAYYIPRTTSQLSGASRDRNGEARIERADKTTSWPTFLLEPIRKISRESGIVTQLGSVREMWLDMLISLEALLP